MWFWLSEDAMIFSVMISNFTHKSSISNGSNPASFPDLPVWRGDDIVTGIAR